MNTTAETEFMMAMNAYKHRSGRMFPTWSEVLEVLRDLGYEKIEPARRDGETTHRQAHAPVAAR